MVKIFAWTGGEGAGAGRIRAGIPLDKLSELGHKTKAAQALSKEWGDSDTIVGVRISKDKVTRLWQHICGYPGGPFTVFETDDDLLGIEYSNLPIVRNYWRRPDVRWRYIASLRIAHRVLTSTEYLANLLYDQTGHPDIVVAPTTVPDWLLDLPLVPPRADGKVTVGWAGGASHEGDWDWMRSGLRRAILPLDNVEFHCMGVDYGQSLRLPAERYRYTDWLESVDEFWRAIDFHIALAPLRPARFNRSKSALKYLEAAARGIPVVASKYGPYVNTVKHEETGFLVSSSDEWIEAIRVLVQDEGLRAKMGAAAREHAKSLTIGAVWPQYLEAYTP